MVTCLSDEVRSEVKRLVPPDERDREIFRRVRGGRESQAAVAKEFGISQPRVSQIVESVQTWLVEATPEETGDLPPEKRLRLGANLVRVRLECLLDATMQSWRDSHGELTTTRSGDERTERVTRTSFGDVKYLTAFRHVTLALARLDGVPIAPKVERQELAVTRTETVAKPIEVQAAPANDLYVEPVAAVVIEPVAAAAVAKTPVAATSSASARRPNPAPVPRKNAQKSAYQRAWEHREKRRQKAAQRRAMLAAT